MILLFPDLDTLRLALTSGAMPAAVSQAPVAAGFDQQGQVWLQPSVSVPRAALAALRHLKVQVPRSSPVPLTERCHCWPQLLPLERIGDRLPPEQTPVLFDLPADQVAAVVTEVLRLGNDRQGFRHLAGPDGSERALLRIVGPPYYSLLRALDRDTPDAGPVAYIEYGPRLWIEVGHTHPFAGLIKVPDGKILLLRPPRQWTVLDDVPFRDVYEILEFTLPTVRSQWQDLGPGTRLRVPLRLVPADPSEAEELWVLRDRAIEQLDEFVSNADDNLLRQLSFAVAEKDGQTVVVVRVRPTKATPPKLVLPGVAFRSYQKLPNLFVPAGRRLHPPLSRHVLRALLAENPDLITWLYPDGAGGFTPETLPDEAFRPLGDWTDYVLDRDRQALTAWVQAAQFDFEPFVCADDGQPARPKKPATERRQEREEAAEPVHVADLQPTAAPAQPEAQAEPLEEFTALAAAEPGALEQQLAALEQRFLSVDGPLDSNERRALWPKLAALNTRLGRDDDAGLCWMSALWSDEVPPPASCWHWFRAEAAGVPMSDGSGLREGRSWAAVSSLAAGKQRAVDGADLERVLALGQSSASDVRALAAYLVWAARTQLRSPPLQERLPRVREFIETYERLLPVRAAWLAWLALARLAGDDILTLARARDRLLERLFVNGLSARQDLPAFLRWSGKADGQRSVVVRQWLRRLCDLAHDWVKRSAGSVGHAQTEAYVDLIFAFGLARVGEAEASRQLARRAESELPTADEAHLFLLQAFNYRISQALQGKAHTGPLPADQMEYLAEMGAPSREQSEQQRKWQYAIDRLRHHSRILEPEQKIEPYRHLLTRTSDHVERTLANLPDVVDRDRLAEAIAQLLAWAPRGKAAAAEKRAYILRGVLDQAPRVSPEFAREILDDVAPTYDSLPPPADQYQVIGRATLLDRGLFIAGHFDWVDLVQAFVGRFELLLRSLNDAQSLQGLDSIIGESFRGLRKLGLRQESEGLLALLATRLLAGRPLEALTADAVGGNPSLLRGLLHAAAAWYYFGRDEEADRVVALARAVLLTKPVENRDEQQLLRTDLSTLERGQLACTYAATLGQAPPASAEKGIEQLFGELEGIRDAYLTSSHYQRLHLEVIEAVVWAVASDDFPMGSAARRWLDDDEFLVRRRIHRDVRALVRSES
jgi:hypothetical protein